MPSADFPRLAGTLVPVFALRHDHDLGIGDTRAVRDAIAFSAEHKLGLLQLLPINETGDDNSPYNAISSVALDPVYLHLSPKEVPGLTEQILADKVPASLREELQKGPVQYRRVKQLKLEILSLAYIEFEAVDLDEGTDLAYEFQAFVEANMGWLPGYTLFRTLLNEYNNNPIWPDWAPEHQGLVAAETWLAQTEDREELVRYRQFTAYIQWITWRQWLDVRLCADRHGIRLVGDIPFGVSRYGADVWSEPELFDLTWSGGAPPEPFFDAGEFIRKWGQNWGIPLYNWEAHRAQKFEWWKQRVSNCVKIFHSFRLDHVLGLFRIYSFPWMPQQNDQYLHLSPEQAKEKAGGRVPHFKPRADEPEESARLNCADGEALLKMLKEAAGSASVVAEDLGVVPKYVPALLQKLRIPGFAIPQFFTDPETRQLIPKGLMPEISVATWGTHDHAPLVSWYHDLTKRWHGPNGHEAWLELQRIMHFLGENENEPPARMTEKLHEAFLRTLLEAKSCWTILVVSDVLGLDIRFNQPGTAGDENWSQRLDRPLTAYSKDPALGVKFRFLADEIVKTGREPAKPEIKRPAPPKKQPEKS